MTTSPDLTGPAAPPPPGPPIPETGTAPAPVADTDLVDEPQALVIFEEVCKTIAPFAKAGELAVETVERLCGQSKIADELCTLLAGFADATGSTEGAVDVLKRLLEQVGGFAGMSAAVRSLLQAAPAFDRLQAAPHVERMRTASREDTSLLDALEHHRTAHQVAVALTDYRSALEYADKAAKDMKGEVYENEQKWGARVIEANKAHSTQTT